MFRLTNISSLFFLLCFSFPLVSPVMMQVKEVLVQMEMMEALETEELVDIRVKTSQIQWIKSKRECFVNGELFDVKRLRVINDETLLTGLFDQKEKTIKNKLENFAKKQEQSNKQEKAVKLFSVVSAKPASCLLPLLRAVIVNRINQYRVSIYTNPFLGFEAPPPKYS